MREPRPKLDAVQDTIARHDMINAQLRTDLMDKETSRQAFEERLPAVEIGHGERVKTPERRSRSLDRAMEEQDRRIAGKDAAISELLAELLIGAK